jgi:hypothetical protein
MISKNFTKALSLALATLVMTQALGQQAPEGTAQPKSPKRIISNVAQKRAVKTKDIIQGAVIGSVLLSSSFFVQDPNLKIALRVLAFAPMVVGFFMPQKFYQKFDKLDLELDEAGCSSTNYMCKGICADCRITKSYLAAIPVTLIPYAIYSFFTKRPTNAPAQTPINPDAHTTEHNPTKTINPDIQNENPNQVTANPAGHNNPINQPIANPAVQNAQQNNANQNQEPAVDVREHNQAQPNINAIAAEPTAEQARPAADAVQVEALQLQPQENNAPEAQPAVPANNAPQPDVAPVAAVQDAQANQQPQRQGWGEWFNAGRDRFDNWLVGNLLSDE